MKSLPVLLVCLACGLLCPSVRAETFQPQSLHVVGGEETWHADPSFELRWSNPKGVAAVHYRVLTAAGTTAIAETTVPGPATALERLQVPAVPGIYTAEVWLESSAGWLGAAASGELRFDDSQPGPVGPSPLPRWIGRSAFPLTIHLDPPQGTPPPSGIRGYAYAVDRDPEGEPCADPRRCGEAEIDLLGGVDSLQVPDLPEGTSYLHAVAVSGSGMRSTETATVALDVDRTVPATTLFGARSGWSSQPVKLLVRAADSGSGMAMGGNPLTPFTAISVDGGSPIAASGDSVTATVIASGVHTVSYYACDAAGNVADGAVVNGVQDPPPETAVVRVDRESPTVAFAPSQDPRDPERIEAIVGDPVSGFDRSRGSIALRPAGSRRRFQPLPTQGRGDGLTAHWDSSSFAPGLYEFRAVAYDAAGNAASSLLRSNGSRMTLRAPLKIPTALVARLRGQVVGYGARALFAGRLTAGRNTPLAGRPVRVIERFAPTLQSRERVSTVTTGAEGRFAVRLRRGPGREVVAITAPTAALAGASSRPAPLQVRGRIGMHSSAAVATVGGRPIVFSGRVSAPPFPAGGKAVELQFRLPGLPWSQFRTVTADARGRFRYAYRFVDDDSRGARFQFRAVAPAQAGWPYLAAGSRPVTVRGR